MGTPCDVPILILLPVSELLTQAKSLNDSTVAVDVAILQVVEEGAALTYQHGQSSFCAIIFTVYLEVFRQMGYTV